MNPTALGRPQCQLESRARARARPGAGTHSCRDGRAGPSGRRSAGRPIEPCARSVSSRPSSESPTRWSGERRPSHRPFDGRRRRGIVRAHLELGLALLDRVGPVDERVEHLWRVVRVCGAARGERCCSSFCSLRRLTSVSCLHPYSGQLFYLLLISLGYFRYALPRDTCFRRSLCSGVARVLPPI